MSYLLSDLLVTSARRSPDSLAVSYRGESMTYAQLDEASSLVAGFLRRKGVGPGDRVGLMVTKGTAAIVSIFAALKAGAVYVPIDPAVPPVRAAFIIRDCAARFLVTSPQARQRSFGGLLDEGDLETVLVADGEADQAPPGSEARAIFGWKDAFERSGSDAPEWERRIDTDLAYILYTSGSTGQPKGVMISHRNALTFVDWCAEEFRVVPEDRLSNHAPFHFDLSVFDVFVAMKAGASVHPVPEGLSSFPIRLSQWIADEAITIWYSVPSILTLLTLHGRLPERDLSALRTVLFAGEVFPLKHLQALVAAVSHPRFVNLYGPTETNVCTYHDVDKAALQLRSDPLPIGRACANVAVFAVDEDDRPLPAGEVGELLVRGSGVALGYWGRPERTALGFVRNPLEVKTRDIVYRTGDLVALDERGEYHYLGRKDQQIKSRGYRIELGEIEHALQGHAGVREAAAVGIPDDLLGNRILVVVVPVSGEDLSPVAIQAYCAERLPAYMVPEAIELRDELPRTPNGKVDRQNLAASVR